MSITGQSISLSVPASILPQASPTSVSVKLLTPCQQWRRAYLDPVDGWVLVDLSHTNIFSASAERGVARVCVSNPPPTHIHTSFPDQVSELRQYGAPLCHLLTPSVSSLDPDGRSTDPTVTNKGKDFFLLQMLNLTHVLCITTFCL